MLVSMSSLSTFLFTEAVAIMLQGQVPSCGRDSWPPNRNQLWVKTTRYVHSCTLDESEASRPLVCASSPLVALGRPLLSFEQSRVYTLFEQGAQLFHPEPSYWCSLRPMLGSQPP